MMRKLRTNAEMREIFDRHDPGDYMTVTERLMTVSRATGIKYRALEAACQRGKWNLTAVEPLNWPSITSGGVTYWQKPTETRAEFEARVNNRKRVMA